jgi:subtilisin family serine protease
MYIAGLIRCVAPHARVTVVNSLRWAGAMTEAGVAQTIMDVLDDDPPDIISLSAGYMVDQAAGGAPRAMRDVMKRLEREDCRTTLVAATGNDGHGPEDHGLFYPAAFANEGDYVDEGILVAVGALREDRKGRACFSNYGDWVTVYEEGENLVNVFPTGRYVYREPISDTSPPQCLYYPDYPIEKGCTCVSAPMQGSEAIFTGMAAWSGTSFATPIVVGRLARHITDLGGTDRNPRAAVRDLLKQRITITDAGDDRTELSVFPQPAVS